MKATDIEVASSKIPVIGPNGQYDQQGKPPLNKSRYISKTQKHTSQEVTVPSTDRILFNKLENTNTKSQTVIQQIRHVDRTMETVEANVKQMKSSLEKIVKSYPPYPVDNSDRIQSLRQFSAIRKMIDQLTIPPPEDSPEVILGNTETHSNAGDWKLIIGNKEKSVIIKHQPMHTGKRGLDIPHLKPKASDKEVEQVFKKITTAEKIIERRRKAFVADANRMITTMI